MPPPAKPRTLALLTQALQLQRAAYLANPQSSLAQRRQDLLQLKRLVQDNLEALCEAINADYGHRSRHETLMLEVMPVLTGIDATLKHLAGWMKPQRRQVDRLAFGLASNTVVPQALGVVGVLVPWNFPLNLSLVPLTAIFAAGNRAMVKLSENSTHLAELLLKIVPRYFAPSKLQFFKETGGVGQAFSSLPFDHLLFTGSSYTGRLVMAAAAQNLCPVTLELGGKSPAVVCESFSVEQAAERILFVKYLNAGQICTTVDHVFVPRAKVAAFVEAARRIMPSRYPDLASTDYTAIIDARSFKRLTQALKEAKAQGAELIKLIDGPAWHAPTRKIAPHLVLNAPPDCALMREEVFGPILPVLPYERLDEVVAHVNSGPRPLALYPFSHRKAEVNLLIERMMSGGVAVNDALMHVGQHDLPFGGVGESGMGHYHGREGFENFSKLRPVFRQARWAGTSLLVPPYGKVAEGMLRVLMG